MRLADIQGNDDVRKALAGMVGSGRIPHAILFHEDDGGGAFAVCTAFLQLLYCGERTGDDSCGACPSCNRISKLIHPDVHFIFPTAAGSVSLQYMEQFRRLALQNPSFSEAELGEALGIEGKNSMIAVSEAKSLLETLSLSALEGGYRAVVVYLPEKMNQEAANRLLKIIEEPPALTQFLLITHHPEKVLQTIASRCQRIRIRPYAPAEAVAGEESGQWAGLMEALLARDLLAALDAADEIASASSRESAKAFCKFAGESLRRMFLRQQEMPVTGGVPQEEEWARRCRKTFPRQAMDVLNRAQGLVDRNVNLKILFADMADRLFLLI